MTDTLENIHCPACGNEMTKVYISEKGINIDICANSCGGMYFDNQEIQEFSSPYDDLSEIKEFITGKNFMPVDESQTRICPVCKIPMIKTYALGIQIDTCYKCGGIFLDNEEFLKVKDKFKKRTKVQPVKLNSEIDLREFYKDAQQEKFLEESGYPPIFLSNKRSISRFIEALLGLFL